MLEFLIVASVFAFLVYLVAKSASKRKHEERLDKLESRLGHLEARQASIEADLLKARKSAASAGAETPSVSPLPKAAPEPPKPPPLPAPEKKPSEISSPPAPPLRPAMRIPEPAAPAGPDLEQRIGTGWFSRVGAVVLLFGVAFFVKFSFEQGWVGPFQRILMGALWGLGMLAAGEYFYRRGYSRLSQGLLGGGLGTLYVVIFSAFYFYHFLSHHAAFILMGAVTVGACVLSLRYKVLTAALLAALGGYLTPFLVKPQDTPFQPSLLGYLLVLCVGMLATALLGRWMSLAFLSAVAGYLCPIFMGLWKEPLFALLYLLALGLCHLIVAGRNGWRGFAAFAGFFLPFSTMALAWSLEESFYLFAFLLVLAAAELSLSYLKNWREHELLAWLVVYVPFALGLVFKNWDEGNRFYLSLGFAAAAQGFLLCGHMLPSLAQKMPTRPQHLPAIFMTAFSFFGCALFLLDRRYPDLEGIFAVLVFAVYLAAAIAASRRSGEDRLLSLAFLGLALVFLTLSVPLQLDFHWVSIAWSLLSVVLLALAWRTGERMLERAGAVLGWLTLSRVMLYESFQSPPPGAPPFFNGRFAAFAAAALAFFAGSWLLRRCAMARAEIHKTAPSAAAPSLYGLAGLAVLAVSMGLELDGVSISFAWLALGACAFAFGLWSRNEFFRLASFAVLALVICRLASFDSFLPAGEEAFANARFALYVLMSVWCFAAAWLYAREHRRGLFPESEAALWALYGFAAVFLLWLGANLEIASYFAALKAAEPEAAGRWNMAKHMSYSLFWTVYAAALLAAGIRRRWAALRWGAFALFAVTLAKVMLVDISHLAQIYRIVSFLALGLILMAASWLYHRYGARLFPEQGKPRRSS
jgi:uncharacterized membrane protein